MIPYSEVKENELIPKRFLEADIIPQFCEYCGAELEFSENLNFLQCPNRSCPTKVGARIESMCKLLLIDGFGETTCRQLAKQYHLNGPAQVILVAKKYSEVPGVAGWETKRGNLITGLKKPLQLWEYVKVLNLPGIAGNARSLFEGYTKAEDFFEDIEESQVPLVATRLGISSSGESSVLAVNTYNTLMEYKGEIIGCQSLFNISHDTEDKYTLNVCITQKVPGFANKPAFIDELRKRVGDTINIVWVDRVTEKTHILVGDKTGNTGKMKRAKEINEKHGEQIVFIGDPNETINFVEGIKAKIKS